MSIFEEDQSFYKTGGELHYLKSEISEERLNIIVLNSSL